MSMEQRKLMYRKSKKKKREEKSQGAHGRRVTKREELSVAYG
jgi:hypothetical protein